MNAEETERLNLKIEVSTASLTEESSERKMEENVALRDASKHLIKIV
ncbi:hypothetical protein IPA_07630 [Ignicoccus pacificus DSM 13166]|uniref:Uncharacterized protein n=1 Tax=Ignicoccus pacificus DSM 13166 TaxID=940294 RepID=A0A977KBT5_9CREN|nr:hypothetical protein IPA_07630 [Ignicoccus pacificus DSM 13166]